MLGMMKPFIKLVYIFQWKFDVRNLGMHWLNIHNLFPQQTVLISKYLTFDGVLVKNSYLNFLETICCYVPQKKKHSGY